VLPDAPLNFAEVRNVDADVTFTGEHLMAQNLPLDNVDLHLRLDNAVLTLDPLKVGIAGGDVDSIIRIDASKDLVTTDYDLRFHGFKVDRFLEKAGFAKAGSGTIGGRIRLHGTGNSVRRSLATADGQASLMMDQATISNLAVDIVGLDVAKAVGLIITGDQQIPVRCMVADFVVENGTMTPRTLVLDTDASLITGTGTVNLARERLDLTVKGTSKSPSPLSLGGPIEVGGTFKKPDVGLGKEAVVRAGAAVALGTLLTPLAAVLGFIDSGKSVGTDCMALSQQAQSDATKIPPGTASVMTRHRQNSR
jgi:uncharacterized protein involved in outer membrane biogenesis